MSAAQRAVKKTGDALGDMGKKLTLGVTVPLAALGGLAVRSASQLDSLTRGLSAVLGPAGNVGQELERLADIAKLPGLGFREAIQGFTRLKAAGLSIGLAEDALRGFGNALATVGAGKAELDQVTRALSQIASKGKISAEEINQIAEVVPQIRVVMQEAFGTSNSELLQKAGIDAETFIRKVTDELLKLEQVTGGPQNAFENLSDATFRASAALGDKLLPVVLPLVEGLAKMAEGIRTISPDTVKWGIALAAVAAVAGPLLIVLGSLTTAITAMVAAGASLALIVAVGAPLLIGLGAFSAWLIKNKLDALEAAGALAEFERQQKSLAASLGTSSAPDIAAATKAQLESMREALQLRVQGMGGKMEGQELVFGAFDSEEFQRIQGLFDQIDSRLEEMGQAGADAGNSVADGLAEAAEAARIMAAQLEKVKTNAEEAYQALNRLPAISMAGPPSQRTVAGVRIPDDAGEVFRRQQAESEERLKFGKGLDLRMRPAAAEPDLGFLATLGKSLGGLFDGLKSGVMAVIGAFNPLAILGDVLKASFELMAPALQATEPFLRILAEILGKALVPVLEGLFPVFKGVAIAATYLGQIMFNVAGGITTAIGWAIEAIGKAIDAIPGISGQGIIDAGKALSRAGQGFIEGAAALGDARDEIKKIKWDEIQKSSDKLASSMSNVPVVFSAALARFRIGADGMGGGGKTPGMRPGGGPTDMGPGMVPGRPAFNVTISQAVFNGVEDFDSFKRQMEAYGAEIQVRGGYSNWSPAFG